MRGPRRCGCPPNVKVSNPFTPPIPVPTTHTLRVGARKWGVSFSPHSSREKPRRARGPRRGAPPRGRGRPRITPHAAQEAAPCGCAGRRPTRRGATWRVERGESETCQTTESLSFDVSREDQRDSRRRGESKSAHPRLLRATQPTAHTHNRRPDDTHKSPGAPPRPARSSAQVSERGLTRGMSPLPVATDRTLRWACGTSCCSDCGEAVNRKYAVYASKLEIRLV